MPVHFYYLHFADQEVRHWEERLPRIPQVKEQQRDSVSQARWALLGEGTSNSPPSQKQLWAELSQLCPPGTDSTDLQCCCVSGIKKQTRSPNMRYAAFVGKAIRASGCLSHKTGIGTTKPPRDAAKASCVLTTLLTMALAEIFP